MQSRRERLHAVRRLASLFMGIGLIMNGSAAVVNLTLFNEEALMDQSLDPLLGNALSGDLVQLLTLGVDGIMDFPSNYIGTAGETGDDQLFGDTFIPTHVGAGTFGPSNDSGLLLQSGIQFDDSLVGTALYVRYWNAPTILDATQFGQTGLLSLGSEVAPGEYQLNFAPLGTGPYVTFQHFSIVANTPEPSVLVFMAASSVGLMLRRRYLRHAIRPQQKGQLS